MGTCFYDDCKKKEWLKRRKQRLQQVQSQARDVAREIRQRSAKERAKHKMEYENMKEEALRAWKKEQLEVLEDRYRQAMDNVGLGRAIAQHQPDVIEVMREETEKHRRRAAQRGQYATRQMGDEAKQAEEAAAAPVRRLQVTRQIEDIRAALVVQARDYEVINNVGKDFVLKIPPLPSQDWEPNRISQPEYARGLSFSSSQQIPRSSASNTQRSSYPPKATEVDSGLGATIAHSLTTGPSHTHISLSTDPSKRLGTVQSFVDLATSQQPASSDRLVPRLDALTTFPSSRSDTVRPFTDLATSSQANGSRLATGRPFTDLATSPQGKTARLGTGRPLAELATSPQRPAPSQFSQYFPMATSPKANASRLGTARPFTDMATSPQRPAPPQFSKYFPMATSPKANASQLGTARPFNDLATSPRGKIDQLGTGKPITELTTSPKRAAASNCSQYGPLASSPKRFVSSGRTDAVTRRDGATTLAERSGFLSQRLDEVAQRRAVSRREQENVTITSDSDHSFDEEERLINKYLSSPQKRKMGGKASGKINKSTAAKSKRSKCDVLEAVDRAIEEGRRIREEAGFASESQRESPVGSDSGSSDTVLKVVVNVNCTNPDGQPTATASHTYVPRAQERPYASAATQTCNTPMQQASPNAGTAKLPDQKHEPDPSADANAAAQSCDCKKQNTSAPSGRAVKQTCDVRNSTARKCVREVRENCACVHHYIRVVPPSSSATTTETSKDTIQSRSGSSMELLHDNSVVETEKMERSSLVESMETSDVPGEQLGRSSGMGTEKTRRSSVSRTAKTLMSSAVGTEGTRISAMVTEKTGRSNATQLDGLEKSSALESVHSQVLGDTWTSTAYLSPPVHNRDIVLNPALEYYIRKLLGLSPEDLQSTDSVDGGSSIPDVFEENKVDDRQLADESKLCEERIQELQRILQQVREDAERIESNSSGGYQMSSESVQPKTNEENVEDSSVPNVIDDLMQRNIISSPFNWSGGQSLSMDDSSMSPSKDLEKMLTNLGMDWARPLVRPRAHSDSS